jgi:hypothetical protein
MKQGLYRVRTYRIPSREETELNDLLSEDVFYLGAGCTVTVPAASAKIRVVFEPLPSASTSGD